MRRRRGGGQRAIAAVALAVGLTGCTSTPADPSTAAGAPPPPPIASPATLPQATSTGAPTTTSIATTTEATTIPTTVAAPTTPTVPPVRTVRLGLTGDTLFHSPLWNQARRNAGGNGYDFRPMLAPIAPLVNGVDLAICHLETPIAPHGEELSTAPYYGVPVEIIDALAATGFDRCSTASNHTADRGAAGIDRTVDALEAAGLGQSGMARTPAEIEPRLFEVNGIRISQLSYTFSYNGLSLPAGEEWRSATIEPARIVADATEARRLGAELVLVSLHWGAEGVAAPTYEQRRLAEELTASAQIDLIVGHHAHVLQPIEQINGVWVVFGLGNLISNLPTSARWPAGSQDGALVEVAVSIAGNGAISVERPLVRPTWVDKQDGWLVRPVVEGLSDPAISARLAQELGSSLERTRRVLGDYLG